MKTSRAIALLTPLLVGLSSHPALACAACWNPAGNDKMTSAAAAGIGAMVVIMFVMLGSIAAFGWHLAWRAKHPLPDYDELLGDNPPEDHKPGRDDTDPKA
ncbi:MAG: hypothetical protein WDO13_14385 [Verrucomicrobiota bacterium]